MKVWVLSYGCRYEGGSIDSVYRTEKSGLIAAEQYMQKKIAATAEFNDEKLPCRTYFEIRPNERGDHYWLEHYVCSWKLADDSLREDNFDSEYLLLAWYELQ